jgi:hypothetical protein
VYTTRPHSQLSTLEPSQCRCQLHEGEATQSDRSDTNEAAVAGLFPFSEKLVSSEEYSVSSKDLLEGLYELALA